MLKLYKLFIIAIAIIGFGDSLLLAQTPQKDSLGVIQKTLPANLASVSSTLLSSYEAPNNLLKLTPPNVASIEQYGNIAINYSTGQLSNIIPLHTIDVGDKLSIPIQLSYNNSGLKPEQVPSWVGNGWDLNLSGTVVQYIKGIDDFSAGGLQFTSSELQSYTNGSMTGYTKYQYSTDVINSSKDSQYDVFSFNLLGKTGKFYFNGNNVVFFNYMPLKVSFTNNIFTITDQQGFVFQFSLFINNAGSFSDGFITGNTDPFLVSTKTWYLTKIITPSGVEATFNYNADIAYSIAAAHTSYSVGASVNSSGCVQSSQFAYQGQDSNITVGQYLLTEILWKGKKIVFETIPREDLKDANNNKSKALSKIKVYNENNTLIKQIGFDFGTSSYSRLQLDNVAILDIMDNSKVQQFSFEYYGNAKNILIPSLNSNPINNSVDHWGYYNGKSNLSKIPRANYSLIIPNTSTDFGNANRASDGDASKIGMLKKITYPTQGSTTIAYEPNTVHFDNYASIPFFMKSQHASGYSIFLNSGTKDCNTGPVSGTFTVPQAIVAAKITWVLSTNSSDDLSSFKLSTTGSAPYIINEFAQNTTNGEMITDLPAGTYYYTLYPGCVTQTQNVTAQASFKIEQPVTPSGGIDLSVGGNRVSKVIDYDGTSAYHERNFVYENANLLDIPFYVSTIQTGKGSGTEGGLCGQIICGTTYILGENNVHAWDGFHVEYLKVTENHGANGNNGKKIYRYEPNVFVGGPIATSPYPSTFNLNWRSGNLLIDETYRNESSVFTIMQEVQKNYTPLTIFPITQNGIKIGRKLTCPSGSYATSNPDLYFNTALQPVFSDKFAISSETSKYYAENNTLSSTKNYTYNNDWLLQKTSTTNSKNQVVDIINYYPNDFNNGIANTQINTLKNKHIIGIPLKVIKNINNKTVDGVLINTDAVGNQTEIYHFENNNLITHNHNPSTFFDTNFYLYETRKYSSKGNIVEITPRNSTSKTYVWGYKHSYPIAEVINATKAQVEAQIGNLETIAEYTQDAQISAIGNTLRTNIPTALVTSGVLTSGVGLKSIKSANDISSYFEYDSFNRLKTIRDNNNYIVKNYTYRYAEATGGGSCTVAAPTISATPASIGCNAVLTASGCSGTVTWSNSQTGNTITVPSVTSTTYTATCTTTCTSVASSPITGLTYPTGWNATNIGSPAINGCLVLGNNTIRMQASPSGGIGGTDNDVHYYLNKQFSGNVTIMAKISSMTNTANIRAGIIFKSGLGTKDIFFSIVQDGNNTVGKLHRSAVNDPVTIWQYDNNTPAGVWLKIKKTGNTIQSYYSTASNPSINNDTNWTEFLPNLFGSAPSISWGSNFQIGLTLENPPSANTSTAQVVFTNVQINDNGFISNF